MTHEHKHTMVCQNCGNEADMIIKEEEASSAEHHQPERERDSKSKRTILVCKQCGNEADMILEEIEVDD